MHGMAEALPLALAACEADAPATHALSKGMFREPPSKPCVEV